MRRPPFRVLVVALALLAALGCSDDAPAPQGAAPATEPLVRAETAAFLASFDLTVASFTVTPEGHLGYYLRPAAGWPLDNYVRQLPAAAEAARDLLARHPTLASVDICIDGPWLPREPGVTFVAAARVLLERGERRRWPARFVVPADVLQAGLDQQSLEHALDPRVLRESPAYAAASRELAIRRSAGNR